MMSLTIGEWLALIAVLISIIIALLTGIIKLILIILSKPELIFNIGFAKFDQNVPEKKILKSIKKEPISGIVYGAQAPKKSIAVFFLPLILLNTRKNPIKNISLIINMPSKHVLTNKEISTMIKDKLVGADEKIFKDRIIRTMGEITQIEINIPTLRWREPVCLFELIKFDNFYRPEPIDIGKYITGGKLAERLMKIDNLYDFCIADITVRSENCPPISKQIKILWFDAGSEKDLLTNIEKSVNPALWDGRFPSLSPGLHYNAWPTRLFSFEHWDVKQTYLKIIYSKQGITYCFESYDVPQKNALIDIKVPPRDYYELPDKPKKF